MALHAIRTALEFAVLGPLAVHHGGHLVALAGAKERGVLAFLLLRSNEVVPADRLIDALWPNDPPATARNSLQVRISHLRKVLGTDRIETVRNGYRLTVSADQLDLLRFRTLVVGARAARDVGDHRAATEMLSDSLGLWRGEALPEFSGNPLFRIELAPLEEERLAAFEAWAEAELELGRADELVPELQAAVADNPLRERLMGQLMLALYRAGRQAEALEAYGETRRRLVDELGLDPGPLLTDLQQRILVQDPELGPPCRPQPRYVTAPSRRNLTVAVVLLSVPRELDPEVAVRRLDDVRSRATARLHEHGAVTSLIGGGIVATFGLPATREDDPLRAVEVLLAVADQGETKIALDFGTTLATDEELLDDRFVAELRELADAAQAGEVVVGAGALGLLGGAVDVRDSVVVAFDPAVEPIPRNLDAPLIGREAEFRRLRESFDWAVASNSSHLVTILGAAGIGKSRLARELVADVGDKATVLTGRCLGYGGGAFWPLAEMVRQVAGDASPEALLGLLEGVDERRSVVDQLGAALGTAVGMRAEDAFWAFRKLFGALASGRPLVLVFEDLHWGEERLLDFIEDLVERSKESPILAVCLSRPDLLEKRESWGAGKLDAQSICLMPLSDESGEELIHNLAGAADDDVRARILRRAEGNPLFIEQLVALAEEDPDAPTDAIPASIHAVLSARVDRLPAAERAFLERASIVGLEFSIADVAALSTEVIPDHFPAVARGLIEKDLLRPAGHETRSLYDYRFRHILIRDAIYGSVLKSIRAELHERFARSLEPSLNEGATELEEIIGYHLEWSYNYRKELEPPGSGIQDLGEEAGEHLIAAGRRQLDRSNLQDAIALLERGQRLLASSSDNRADALAEIASAFQLVGRWKECREYLDEALVIVTDCRNPALGAWLRGLELQLKLHAGELPADQFIVIASELVSSLDDPRSAYGARIKSTLAWAHALAGQFELAESLIDEVVASRLHPGDPRKLLPSLWLDGPLPTCEAIRRCESILESNPPPRTAGSCFRNLALLHTMRGEFHVAHSLCDEDQRILDELGLRVFRAASAGIRATIYDYAGQPREAERELRGGMKALRKLGEALYSTGLEVQLAHLLLEQGEDAEARRVLGPSTAASENITAEVDDLGIRARLIAISGSKEEALCLAKRAVALADQTDSPVFQGDARVELGHVLRHTGEVGQAKESFAEAARLFDRKGSLIDAREARALTNS